MAAKQRLQIGIGKTQEKSWWIDTGVSNRTVLPQRGVLRLFARQQLVSRWNICGGERGPPPPTTGGAHRQAHISKKDHQHHQHSHTHTHLLPLRQHFHSTLPNLCTHLPPDESHSPSTHSIVVCWVLMPCRCRGGAAVFRFVADVTFTYCGAHFCFLSLKIPMSLIGAQGASRNTVAVTDVDCTPCFSHST